MIVILLCSPARTWGWGGESLFWWDFSCVTETGSHILSHILDLGMAHVECCQDMNGGIFIVLVMEYMHTQIGPWFVLSSQGIEGCNPFSRVGIKLANDKPAEFATPFTGKQGQHYSMQEYKAKDL